ncbi:MAG: mechanosensitive ion channel family protein [Thermodesulfovibrionales bacterium]
MGETLKNLLIPSVVAVVSVAVLLAIRSIALGLIQKRSAGAGRKVDDIVINAFRVPSVYWCVAIGLHIGIAVSELPQRYVFYISKTIHILVIFSITIATANLADRVFKNYVRQSNLAIPTTGLAFGLLRGAVLSIGLLIILGVLGISIAPLITALGVGGLAVALALQDTLANLFAGIHILAERTIRVGDFVRLETGQEGLVEDISWRTTRIRMPSNNMVVITNSKLSQSIVTNYSLPEKRTFVQIQIGVGYSSDPETIERILKEVAIKATKEVPFLLADPAPDVSFSPGFGPSSLDFTVTCQLREFTDQGAAQHELRKRVFKRLREEAIEIPFPQRTVYLREEKEWKRDGE